MTPPQHLLRPLSAEAPCGPFLGHTKAHADIRLAVDSHLKIGRSQLASWDRIGQMCLDYAQRSKHLEISLILARVWLEKDGLPGLRDGLELVLNHLRAWPLDLHPQPQEEGWTPRLLLLAGLSEWDMMTGDEFGFVQKLSQSTPSIHEDAATHETVRTIQRILGDLQNLLREHVQPDLLPDLAPLLTRMNDVSPTSNPSPTMPHASSASGAPSTPNSAPPGPTAPGSRKAALEHVKLARDFFKTNEPNSPLSSLLDRALRLSTMNFNDLIADLLPDSQAKLREIMGQDEDKPAP